MELLQALVSRIEELEEAIYHASRYQPMYNGRPSCPFCGNFVDDEETHTEDCIVWSCIVEKEIPALKYKRAKPNG
jgi:hypothetical protein